ncbi:hypothetical protein KP509_18G041100 [Ceratopteris richardii]|nr:hypothetical protein KP509_18G041100 [Ceratopteris richardii]
MSRLQQSATFQGFNNQQLSSKWTKSHSGTNDHPRLQVLLAFYKLNFSITLMLLPIHRIYIVTHSHHTHSLCIDDVSYGGALADLSHITYSTSLIHALIPRTYHVQL